MNCEHIPHFVPIPTPPACKSFIPKQHFSSPESLPAFVSASLLYLHPAVSTCIPVCCFPLLRGFRIYTFPSTSLWLHGKKKKKKLAIFPLSYHLLVSNFFFLNLNLIYTSPDLPCSTPSSIKTSLRPIFILQLLHPSLELSMCTKMVFSSILVQRNETPPAMSFHSKEPLLFFFFKFYVNSINYFSVK